MKKFQGSEAHHFACAIAEQALGAAVEQRDPALQVGSDDGHLSRGVNHRPQEGAGLADLFVAPHLLGNVGVGTTHQQRAAVVIAGNDLAAAMHPYPVTILVPQTKLAGVKFRFAGQMFLQLAGCLVQILRVSQPHPGVNGDGLEFLEGITQSLCPAFVEGDFPRDQIPLPSADIGTVDDAGQP